MTSQPAYLHRLVAHDLGRSRVNVNLDLVMYAVLQCDGDQFGSLPIRHQSAQAPCLLGDDGAEQKRIDPVLASHYSPPPAFATFVATEVSSVGWSTRLCASSSVKPRDMKRRIPLSRYRSRDE